MTAPTKEEIQAGYDAITKDGPDAPITAELSLLALRDPILAAVLARMTRVGGSPASTAYSTPYWPAL